MEHIGEDAPHGHMCLMDIIEGATGTATPRARKSAGNGNCGKAASKTDKAAKTIANSEAPPAASGRDHVQRAEQKRDRRRDLLGFPDLNPTRMG